MRAARGARDFGGKGPIAVIPQLACRMILSCFSHVYYFYLGQPGFF